MNRRDFLHPRRLAQTAGDAWGSLLPAPADASSRSREFAVLRLGRTAMATRFEIIVPFGTPNAVQLAERGLDEVDRLENQLTVYREDSEVSRINREASLRPMLVAGELFDLLSRCLRLGQETSGTFDVACGALVKAWGFHRRQGRVPSPALLAETMGCVGMKHVQLDGDAGSVFIDRPGVELNFGSIGKGHALDQALAAMREEANLPSVLCHGGQSSVRAVGNEPGGAEGWIVGIRHPWNVDRRMAAVRLRNQALGTSSATFQHFELDGRKLGHILDPRTGWPSEGIASATAIAPTAEEADALATAFFVLGVEETRNYCASHPEVSAILLPDEADRPIVIGAGVNLVDLPP